MSTARGLACPYQIPRIEGLKRAPIPLHHAQGPVLLTELDTLTFRALYFPVQLFDALASVLMAIERRDQDTLTDLAPFFAPMVPRNRHQDERAPYLPRHPPRSHAVTVTRSHTTPRPTRNSSVTCLLTLLGCAHLGQLLPSVRRVEDSAKVALYWRICLIQHVESPSTLVDKTRHRMSSLPSTRCTCSLLRICSARAERLRSHHPCHAIALLCEVHQGILPERHAS